MLADKLLKDHLTLLLLELWTQVAWVRNLTPPHVLCRTSGKQPAFLCLSFIIYQMVLLIVSTS